MIIGELTETYPPMQDGVGRVCWAYCQALEKNGFRTKRVPLYTDSLELESLHSVSPEKAREVISNWKETCSLIVTVD